VLDATEDRLGDDGRALRDALTQVQVVFVQLRSQAEPGAEPGDAADDETGD
jgi:hypothetical protein